jgi:hypothetical protein
MPYQYTEFDGVDLPPYDQSLNSLTLTACPRLWYAASAASSTNGTPVAATPYRRPTASAAVMWGRWIIWLTAWVISLVDDVGDYLVTEDAVGNLRSQVADLRAKIRTRGSLWRVWQDDTTVREWKTARLTAINHTISRDSPLTAADVTCQLETSMAYWHAETVTTVSASAVASVANSLLVDNAGETVDDATITFTRTSGTITAIALTCAELGIGLAWTGSLGSGHVLTIDAGAQTIADNTTDSYSGFSLVTHTAAGWLTIPRGTYVLGVTVTGGNATVALSYYTQTA